jgi:hypothetical protein
VVFAEAPPSGYSVQVLFRDYPDGYVADVTDCSYADGLITLPATYTPGTSGNDFTSTLQFDYSPLAVLDDEVTLRVRCLLTFADVHIPVAPARARDVVQLLASATAAVTHHTASLPTLPVAPAAFTAVAVAVDIAGLYLAVDLYKLRAVASLLENEVYDVLSPSGNFSTAALNAVTARVHRHTPAVTTAADDVELYGSAALYYLQWLPETAADAVRQALAEPQRVADIVAKVGFRLGTGRDVAITVAAAHDDEVTLQTTCLNGRLTAAKGETGVDCGGACSACVGGQACAVDEDCLQTCVGGVCTGNAATGASWAWAAAAGAVVAMMMAV